MASSTEWVAPKEFGLINWAVRRALQPEARVRAPDLAELDWDLFVWAARQHRSLRLVLAGLTKGDGPAMPPAALDRLRSVAAADVRANLARAAETLRLCRVLADSGVPVIVLKGVVLSQQLHGDPTWRGAGDIDLLVHPERFREAEEQLSKAGYRRDDAVVPAAGQWMIRDVTFRHPAGFLVELHQRLTANGERLATDFDALWHDREMVRLAGGAVAALPSRILPLYLCVHGHQHCWERLCWVADLAALCRTGPDATAILADAREAGLGSAMELGMHLAHDWLGAPLPAAHGLSPSHAERFKRSFFGGSEWVVPPARGSWAWFGRELRRRRHLYALKSGWRYRWHELRADLYNPIDGACFPLGGRLLWLYPLFRPVGWVLRNLCRRARRTATVGLDDNSAR
ncbi:MAG TPA: nucleotidyltransferase family protein [Magnetospirillum sp.]|nr:nucleotidyltransferase family protein [Magnetospirillum sp.]